MKLFPLTVSLFILALGVCSPSSFAQDKAQDDLVAVCQNANAYYPDRVPGCLKQFKGKRVDVAAIKACQNANTYYPDRVPGCLLPFAGYRLANQSLIACQNANTYYPDRVPGCLKELLDLNVTDSDLSVCQNANTYYPDRVPGCLKSISQPFKKRGENLKDRLIDLLSEVLMDLDANNISAAKEKIQMALDLIR